MKLKIVPKARIIFAIIFTAFFLSCDFEDNEPDPLEQLFFQSSNNLEITVGGGTYCSETSWSWNGCSGSECSSWDCSQTGTATLYLNDSYGDGWNDNDWLGCVGDDCVSCTFTTGSSCYQSITVSSSSISYGSGSCSCSNESGDTGNSVDLSVSNVSASPSQFYEGSSINIYFDTYAQASISSSNITATYYISTSSSSYSAGISLGTYGFGSNIPSGTNAWVESSVYIPYSFSSGQHYLWVVINNYNDNNNDNNYSYGTVYIY